MSDKIEITESELQEKIKAAVSEATDGLIKKRDELLNEVKQLRKGKGIKPEELDALETRADELESQLKAAHKELKAAQKKAEDVSKILESEQNFTKSLLIDNALTQELTKHNVTNPALLKGATSILKSAGADVYAEGDQRIAKIGDKTISEYVTAWVGSDEGKHFQAAQNNSGGGAAGGHGGGAANKVEGKIDGSTKERAAYFASKFPELKTA